jgi:hypothetical protein
MRVRALSVLISVLILVLIVGCSSDDSSDSAGSTTGAPAESTTTTTAPVLDPERYEGVIEALADDELEGRDNRSDGSVLAQEFLVDQLGQFAEPLPGAGDEGYRWEFAEGTNLLGVIPGGELAEEYVILGAHYDGLGLDCPTGTPGDVVCNGAADNATGVATVLEIGRVLAGAPEPPRRSVILALWDAEEDGLLGAEAYVADPAVPLEDTVTYLNWDIQATNLSPSTADITVMVGAETGGPNLVTAATAATEASTLHTLPLSLLFGQGRSDHAPFAAAGVPTVFFTDANNGCYHTSQDDVAHLDLDKLSRQIPMGLALAQDLVATDEVPAFVPDAPAATYADAVGMHEVVEAGTADLDRLTPEQAAQTEQYLTDLTAIVDAGEAAFDDAAMSTMLGGAVALVEALSEAACEVPAA